MEILINNTTNGEIFTTLFQHMKLFTENVNVYFREDELFIQGMDKSHVSIFEIKLPKDWFDKYELSTEIILGINTNILFKVLNTREKTHERFVVLHFWQRCCDLPSRVLSRDFLARLA